MRIFMNQTNLITTSPAVDENNDPITTAIITVRILDSGGTAVTGSTIILEHVAEGIYKKVMPVLATLDAAEDYFFEVTATLGGVVVFYLKEPTKAIIRSSQPGN